MAASIMSNSQCGPDVALQQRNQQHKRAVEALAQAAREVTGTKLRYSDIETAAVTPPCAENPGVQLVNYAASKNIDIAILGSRGYGSWRRSLLSCVGLGSVSDYCLKHLRCPILVMKQQFVNLVSVPEPQPHHVLEPVGLPPLEEHGHRRKICIACDAYEHSEAMVLWALKQVLTDADEIHLISVADFVAPPAAVDGLPPDMYREELHRWKVGPRSAPHHLATLSCLYRSSPTAWAPHHAYLYLIPSGHSLPGSAIVWAKRLSRPPHPRTLHSSYVGHASLLFCFRQCTALPEAHDTGLRDNCLKICCFLKAAQTAEVQKALAVASSYVELFHEEHVASPNAPGTLAFLSTISACCHLPAVSLWNPHELLVSLVLSELPLLQPHQVHCKGLYPTVDGGQGVGESISKYLSEHEHCLLLLGSRGLGGFER